MIQLKLLTKSVKKIQRTTIKNKKYKSRIKTFTKKCLLYIKKYQIIKDNVIYLLIFKNLNLAFSALDKCLKLNILHKRNIAKKKSKLQLCVNQII
uniref:Ribosomal protein S20 n=1 Tax=Pteridomonas sp. YPF1301 TaxID=2766739 RepID=A0A7G1MS39_9STRA|nr:ribosomal protein S20 [Pteridomonas sp. YPF1301]